MSGQVPFVYISTCGDVFSAVGLRTLSTSTGSSSTPSPPSERSDETTKSSSSPLDICPQCGTSFDKKKDVRAINPSTEEALIMREVMMANRVAAKAAKSAKKRKAAETESGAISAEAVDGGEVAKRSKKTDTNGTALSAPSTNASFAVVTKKVAQELAEEEKRRKSTMSSAVASLYQSKKNPKSSKETFLTMNTFTRVSMLIFADELGICHSLFPLVCIALSVSFNVYELVIMSRCNCRERLFCCQDSWETRCIALIIVSLTVDGPSVAFGECLATSFVNKDDVAPTLWSHPKSRRT
jgi:hypothetical protein